MTAIEGSRCTCGCEVYPARPICPDCRRAMAVAPLPTRGVVESWTTIDVPPEGFDAPLHVALVRMGEPGPGRPGVRVIARTPRAVETGSSVELRIEDKVLWAQPA